MKSQLTIRSLARASGIWTRPVSSSSVRFADDKSFVDQVKDKAGRPPGCVFLPLQPDHVFLQGEE